MNDINKFNNILSNLHEILFILLVDSSKEAIKYVNNALEILDNDFKIDFNDNFRKAICSIYDEILELEKSDYGCRLDKSYIFERLLTEEEEKGNYNE
jgi:hypothetical protein